MANAISVALRQQRTVVGLREAAVGFGAALGLGAMAFASGGYFPAAWGWGGLVALWLVATYLVVGRPVLPAPLAFVSLGGLVAFGGLTWLALLWTENTSATVLEGQRLLLYVGALSALVLIVRRPVVPALLGGTLVAVFLASGYGLATRLFPERLGVFDPIAGYRLEEPLGYWNALGIFAAMGSLLALGLAARARSVAARVAAAAALPIFLSTLYFTFSRGAWMAAGIGLLIAVALDPRRLQLLATSFALFPAPALAVLAASRQDALTHSDAPLAAATREGHRLAVSVVLFAALAALLSVALVAAERRFRPGRAIRTAFAGGLAVVAIAVLAGVFVRYGGPTTLARKALDAFEAPSTSTGANLNSRLFTFSGSRRAELWEVAWDDSAANPLHGSGPGTYEQYWDQHRRIRHKVRDAHNLYLEVLAELGPLGLALLLVALAAPLAAAVVARRHPLVPAGLAAYAAYLAHAAVDWDWEMGAVTLAALICAAALLAVADRREGAPRLSGRVCAGGVAAALVLSVPTLVGLVGAGALDSAQTALDKGRYADARSEARKASHWWRWSPEPWRQLGDTQAAEGKLAEARASYSRAIREDRSDWFLWYSLASVSDGPAATRALAETARLNPYYRSDLEEAGRASS